MDDLMSAASAVDLRNQVGGGGAGGAFENMLDGGMPSSDEAQARAAILGDGAARSGEGFVPGFSDPADDGGGGEVPDEVWCSDEFQDKLWNWTRQAAGPSMTTESERKTQFVRPAKGFAMKTADRAGGKVFINVCASPQVPKPPPITAEMLQEEQTRVRIPLSMGEPREDTDKEGKECTVYDAIMHTEVVERAKTEKEMKQFVVELCLQWVEQKFELALRRPVKFPKGMLAKGEPDIQTIRRNTNHMVAEVGKEAYQPQKAEPVEEPEFSVALEESRVVVIAAMPRIESAEGISLEHSSRRLFLKAEGHYSLTVMLPESVEKEGADSEFNKTDKTLTVWLARAKPEEDEEDAAGGPEEATLAARQPTNNLVMELD
jgi:HSP20 family molecular chaperone IbpA